MENIGYEQIKMAIILLKLKQKMVKIKQFGKYS